MLTIKIYCYSGIDRSLNTYNACFIEECELAWIKYAYFGFKLLSEIFISLKIWSNALYLYNILVILTIKQLAMSVNSQPMFNTSMFNDLPFYASFQVCGQLGIMSVD